MAKTSRRLAADSLGIIESIVMGVAGTAPAFSIAATTTTLIATVGSLAPATIVCSGVITFGITLAFMHLNHVIANAGGSYAWVSAVFDRTLGFFAGWALLVASALFMVSGSIPAATATLALLMPAHVNDPVAVAGVAAAWLTVVSAVVILGIRPTSYVQLAMTTIEIGVLVLIICAGAALYFQHPLHTIDVSWIQPTEFNPDLFAHGALIALFLFWGWDVTINLNEETRNSTRTPGMGAFWAMLVVTLIFATFVTVVLLVLPDQQIDTANANIIFVVAQKIFPWPWAYLAIIAVMFSTIGTLETSIVQFTRTLYAEARGRSLHPRYAILHPTRKSPWVSTLLLWLIGIVLLFFSSYVPTIKIILKDSINAVALQIAFYYSLTGFACAWHFRHEARSSIVKLITRVLWPILSATLLIFAGIISIRDFDTTTKVLGIGGMAIGLFPLLMNRIRQQP